MLHRLKLRPVFERQGRASLRLNCMVCPPSSPPRLLRAPAQDKAAAAARAAADKAEAAAKALQVGARIPPRACAPSSPIPVRNPKPNRKTSKAHLEDIERSISKTICIKLRAGES